LQVVIVAVPLNYLCNREGEEVELLVDGTSHFIKLSSGKRRQKKIHRESSKALSRELCSRVGCVKRLSGAWCKLRLMRLHLNGRLQQPIYSLRRGYHSFHFSRVYGGFCSPGLFLFALPVILALTTSRKRAVTNSVLALISSLAFPVHFPIPLCQSFRSWNYR
jgi:hypothetical protein